MKWVPDKTGRFALRPHYSPNELEAECEKVVSTFLRKRYGQVSFPIGSGRSDTSHPREGRL